MSLQRRTHRQVLGEDHGIATSIPEALAGIGLKGIGVAIAGGIAATLLVFWAVSTASADTSSGFQNTNVAFEKAVHESDVVVGIDDDTVGLLRDVDGARCEVQTWQGGTRDGKTTLQVDTATVDGVCTPTTPLLEPGSTELGRELLFDIDEPAFTYANLGGREITYDSEGTPTLTTGAKPEGTKQGDWDDVRPYKVSLTLQALDADTAKVTRKAVVTGYTDVMNVTAASDSLRYVPSPDNSPIPGPVTITGIVRSTTTGTEFAGAREGIAVTFAGAVCESGPTKVGVTYTMQSPSAAPAVNTVLNAVLNGAPTTVHLGDVPNGSSGAVEVSASCVEDGAVEKVSSGYTQPVPVTELSVEQNAEADEKHDLTWVQVSSLPTEFEVRRSYGDVADELLTTTDKLAYQSVFEKGGNLGLTTTYTVVAVVDSNRSPAATAEITNPLPKPDPTTVTTNFTGANWTAVSCTPGSTAEYAPRYYQQTGTDTTVNWEPLGAWQTGRQLLGVTTPAYGRTVVEVHSRCVSSKSGVASEASVSEPSAQYTPEAITVTATRSTTVGTLYSGAREGVLAMYSGARCYGDTPTQISGTWQPTAPTGQTSVKVDGGTKVLTGATESVNIPGAANGSKGQVLINATCTAGNSRIGAKSIAYTQPVPAPVLTVAEGTSVNQHVLTWTAVSSLPTTFQVAKNAQAGSQYNTPPSTTGLTQVFTYSAGTNYDNKTDYSVQGIVAGASATSTTKSITGAWPTIPKATSIAYTRTGTGTNVAGRINWSFSGACPAGTTMQTQAVENRTGASNGTISTAVKASTGWIAQATSYNWAPSYRLQGYAYGMRIDTKCVSNVTGFESDPVLTQGSNFVTAMAQPAAPVWDAYNYREWVRGTNWTYSTCLRGGCPSMRIDYITYCPSGSTLGWSNFTSTDWNPASYNHEFGWEDNWLNLGPGARNVTYHSAKYSCDTPWATSPQSPVGASKIVTVNP